MLRFLKPYYVYNVNPEEAYNNFLNTKPIRDIYLDFMESIVEVEDNYAEILAETFEYLYNKLSCVRTFNLQASSAYETDFDVYKTLFMGTVYMYHCIFSSHKRLYGNKHIVNIYIFF